MKGFMLLAFCAIGASGAAIPETQQNHGENGWFVPRLDGTFNWIDKQEAEDYLESSEGRLPTNRVSFYVFTKANLQKGQEIVATKESISNSNFNAKNPTRITIHGWTSSKDDFVNSGIRQAWLHHGDYNMIAVDWERARSVDYASSVLAIPGAGQKIAALVNFLYENFELNLDSLQIIGHSLGAHVAGYAGKHIKVGKVGTIIGLDPALPLYSFDKPAKRLCNTDAKYVESIQTNGGNLGFLKPIGSAAFYPNGGKSQPGCGLDIAGACAHGRSVTYHIEALYLNNFASLECSSYEDAVGNNCGSTYTTVRMSAITNSNSVSGIYYVPIKNTKPYGMLES